MAKYDNISLNICKSESHNIYSYIAIVLNSSVESNQIKSNQMLLIITLVYVTHMT